MSAAALVLASLAFLTGVPTARRATSSELGLLVPAYFYPSPGSSWSDLNAAAAQVPLTAIVNPASGPGGSADENYQAAVEALRRAGGRVVGYVPTGYGLRPFEEVTEDVDRYAQWYKIDGIFVDEMSNSGAIAVLDFYGELYNYVKSLDVSWEVIGNPGTNTHQSHALRPTADRFVVTENTGAAYQSYVPSPWYAEMDASRFAHLVHSEASGTTMADYVDLAQARHAGLIYITDDVLPNPWNSLPAYWDAEVAAIVAVNQNTPSGDYDGNGAVEQGDLDLVLLHWGQDGSVPPVGWHNDLPSGPIDQGELDAVLLAWGNRGSAAGVPEPATLPIVILCTALILSVPATGRV
jgi:hypothetical protein